MAITIDVITKVVDSSLKGSSDTIDKHFTKSGRDAGEKFAKALAEGTAKSPELQRALDKAADATGKLRVEQEKLNAVNQKSSATDAQKIAQSERLQKAKREEARAVGDAARAYENANTSAGGMLSTLSSLSSGARFGGIIAQADQLSSKFGGVGLAAGAAIGGVAALGVAAAQLGQNLYDLGRQWDDVGDSITARTGKVGADLQAIVDQVASASLRTAATTGELGNIAGQVVQSLRLSGDQVGNMTQKIAELNNLTGEQTSIRQLGEVYRVFGVDAGSQIDVLNGLYDVFTQTGIPVNELIATLQKSGPLLSEFGMSFEQAAGFVTVFENAGVSADSAVKGLKFALKSLAQAGVEPKEGLQQMIAEIQNLIAAGDNVGARDLAESRFGKGFPEILRAIKENRIELEALPDSVDVVTDHIGQATKATADFTEEWQKFKNMFEDALRPVAASFFSFLNDQMTGFKDAMVQRIGDVAVAWGGLFNENWWEDSPFWRALEKLGLVSSTKMLGGGGNFGSPAADGASARDFAHSDMMPYWESKGFAVGDHAADQFGEHQNGAVDVMVPSIAAGQQVLNEALKDPNVYGAIFNNQTYGYGNGTNPQNYTGGHTGNPTQDHQDHVHIWYKPGGSNNIVAAGAGDAALAGVLGGAGIGAGMMQAPSLPGSAVAPTAPVGPGTAAPTPSPSRPPAGTFTPGNFTAAGDVAAASPNATPVQMVPSPFGPQYQPVPAGSTPGFNQYGKPGTYLPDPGQIDTATKSYEQSVENVTEANQAIEEAKQRQLEAAQKAAQVEQDLYSTAEDRQRANDALRRANEAVDRAVKSANRANDSAEDAEQRLAEAKRGTFREAQQAAKAKADKLKGEMAPLADDFGLSEGLPGLAKWLTTFAMNMAIAPMVGGMSAVSAASPYQGGSGLLGMLGAQNMAAGLTPLGLSSGAAFTPGVTPAAMGPAPLGGGVGANLIPGISHGAAGGGAPGPVGPGTSVPSLAPTAGPGGGGFQGLGGLPMGALSGAVSAAGLGLDAMAPGAGQAAQVGVQLANRTAGYIGQLAGIGVGGLLETFLPHGSPLADPGKSWVGRIAAGFAGARPALPNAAGGQQQGAGQPAAPQTPQAAAQLAQQASGGQSSGPMVNVENLNNYSPDGGQAVANQIGRLQMSSYAAGGPR